MVSPARSVSRLALSAVLALSVVLRPGVAAAQFASGDTLIGDTEIEEILKKDVAPLFQAAGLNPKSIQIILVGSKDINASAGPGVMMVSTALILQSKNPNELQGVMAHEVGHLAAGHSFRSGDMQRAGMVPFLLTMGLGILAAVAGSGEGAAGLISSGPLFRGPWGR